MDPNHPETELCALLGQMNLTTVTQLALTSTGTHSDASFLVQESYPAEPEAIMVDDTSCDVRLTFINLESIYPSPNSPMPHLIPVL